jgi:uncharacterized protein (DUF1330 family)
MEGKATLVVTAVPNPDEMESMDHYRKGAMSLLTGAGGKLVKLLKVGKVITGNPSAMSLVMDFDSAEAIIKMFEPDEYAALIPIRDKGFKEMNILLTQDM